MVANPIIVEIHMDDFSGSGKKSINVECRGYFFKKGGIVPFFNRGGLSHWN
jgi:hypothetical protein